MIRSVLWVAFLFFATASSASVNGSDPEFNAIFKEMQKELKKINAYYAPKIREKELRIQDISAKIYDTKETASKIDFLIQKDLLKEEILSLKKEEMQDLSKIRYLKGLQIIRLLYEKVLSLDHHFASVRTFSEINKISNPNQYPEYEKLKEIVKSRKDRKAGFDLTSILGTNTIVSVVQTFSNLMVSSLSKDEKDKEIANIECILDFTLRMQNELNTIYFETAFLQKSNEKIRTDIETLFKEYTKPIGYANTLESCRTSDDWESVKQKTNDYLANLKTQQGPQLYSSQVNIIFPIDRLLQFITQYNSFIDQGGKFYEKFKIILNSYENEKQCETKLPLEYKKLKDDIDVAISKFNMAYRPVEVNGSKMKEILYGINEFE
ncbi:MULTISPECIES: hypothetical protein [Flavobacterium]|jgi:hypothetical protein|uniref:hypothetical protein n=1 Tax=Flavobacterium TaxID=237 RepID=UPI0006FD73B7|nr:MULTISPECIES: hypothetical protein [Flavobacterium]MBU7571675.1 hypothetical protein [Flavobacterium sp.]PZO30908.1 MAG: hypothetical protein DCE86_09505 [Flavobacteriaceae bacterium]PZQ85613.1 MAG: hypothetical protein DI548_08295 [Flavobacterium johnsoniae]KQS46413.1 hypothetical protein ASG38_11435 [Flavobacterium sp. Leaf359]MDQ7959218.1 hypothetical protein [Flavobacterium lindanitolerans]